MPKASFPLSIEADDALPPDAAEAHELTNRQRVEELVGDEEEGPRRNLRERSMPGDLAPGVRQRLRLARFQHRARLDKMHRERVAELLDLRRDAENVRHQRAAARPELDELHRRRRADHPPDVDEPGADDLAEHLADLRRGHEIAVRAERVARRVVAVRGVAEAKRHVVGDAHRAVRLDEEADLLAERRVAHAVRRRIA